MPAITRRIALAALVSALPAAAFAAHRRREAPRERILVDVSPLRRNGDNTDADFLADVLPGYLSQSIGPGHEVRVRIDSVTYGPPGSDGSPSDTHAIDWIEGVGWVDGRETPLTCSVVAEIVQPSFGDYGARMRQDTLARSFAQWLPRQVGL
ncbi:MAG TPA: hypothetical protein VN715_17190 [Roseiarcus sp.]|nr:hypothetical protein [Roseiarcus sp.]